MKNYLLLFSIGIFNWGISQTTVTYAANNPISGNTVNNVNVNGTVDNSATGSGVTFNNSSLTMGAAAPTVFSTPSSTEIASFPGSTLKSVDGTGTTTYYKDSTTKLEITGIVNSTATLNFSTDNATAIVYPTAYGNTSSDTAAGTFTYTTYNGTFSGTINNSADASGTLLIGSNTFPNVLRVKSVQNFNLFYAIVPGFPSQVGTATNTIYSYFDNIERYPLLATNDGNISVPALSLNQNSNSAVALQKTFLATLDEAQLKKALFVFPNPVKDLVNISGDISDFDRIEFHSMEGRLIKSYKAIERKLDISDFETGTYMMVLKGKERETVSLKIIKD